MHLQYTVSFILLSTLLIMFSNANRNLRIHNCFTVGPQPTLPCLQLGCYRSFKNRSGCKTHISASHPHLGDPSMYLLPETTTSFAELSHHLFNFQASPNLYWSSSPFAVSESLSMLAIWYQSHQMLGVNPWMNLGMIHHLLWSTRMCYHAQMVGRCSLLQSTTLHHLWLQQTTLHLYQIMEMILMTLEVIVPLPLTDWLVHPQHIPIIAS